MSVVQDLLKANPFGADAPEVSHDRREGDVPEGNVVDCTQCGRRLEARRMLRLDLTMPESTRSVTHWLCPPDARRFKSRWMVSMVEALR